MKIFINSSGTGTIAMKRKGHLMERAAMQTNGHIKTLTVDEGRDLFNRQARRYLKMDGDRFIREWDAGRFATADDPDVMRVAMLLPLVR